MQLPFRNKKCRKSSFRYKEWRMKQIIHTYRPQDPKLSVTGMTKSSLTWSRPFLLTQSYNNPVNATFGSPVKTEYQPQSPVTQGLKSNNKSVSIIMTTNGRTMPNTSSRLQFKVLTRQQTEPAQEDKTLLLKHPLPQIYTELLQCIQSNGNTKSRVET